YVADFVAHMNPLGVLTARDVMGPPTGVALAEVAADAPVREVMALLTHEAESVAVVEDGETVGRISRDMVLARLLDPRG
ncbi:MAG: CBS domain-containing protein, partial [Maritimibacter sp.]|nr:CBS domain-containing protein [Maritimibacter sp.]